MNPTEDEGIVQVHVYDDQRQGLTQSMVNTLCIEGEIGDLLEAENTTIMESLNQCINAGRQLDFVLVNEHSSETLTESDSTLSNKPFLDWESESLPSSEAAYNIFHPSLCAHCMKGVEIEGDTLISRTQLQRCKGCRHVYLCDEGCLKAYWPKVFHSPFSESSSNLSEARRSV